MHSPDPNATFNVRYTHPPTVQELGLGGNQIGDEGVTALANACASGSLAQLKVGSQLNGPLPSPWSLGMHTFLTQTRCSMCNTSAVQELNLYHNTIGDAGVTALANACASGSLAKLTSVFLGGNPGSSEPVDKVLRDRKK